MNRRLATLMIGTCLAGGAFAEPAADKPADREHRKKPGPDYFATMLRGLDKDKDRSISFEEFAAGERVTRLPEEHQRRLYDRLDKNGDGSITRDEIPRGGGAGERMGRPFDPNRDGKVTYEEFRQNPHLAKMPEERKRELFSKMDRDGDGTIGPKDWKRRRPGGGPGRPPGPGHQGLASLDEDGDGSVSFAEFQSSPRMKERPEEMQKKAFDKLDRDGSGSLEQEELRPMGPRPGFNRPEGNRPEGKRPESKRPESKRPGRGKEREESQPQG